LNSHISSQQKNVFHRPQTSRLDVDVAQVAEDLKALEKAKLRDRKRAGVGKLRGLSEMISLEFDMDGIGE